MIHPYLCAYYDILLNLEVRKAREMNGEFIAKLSNRSPRVSGGSDYINKRNLRSIT